jgi:lytic murein transglycosylase
MSVDERFAQWIEAFKPSARAAGIGEATLHQAFDTAHFLPQLIELDRNQPEFNRPVWDYLDRLLTPQRVAMGRQKMQQAQAELQAATARYGVPGSILAAFWGMESDFGRNYGNTPVIDALATLGLEGRREAWAKSELLAALQILQSGDIGRDQMVGSWAGAMGQTQFMPSIFLAYAIDAEGDGRRDIWNSMADVMASTANFVSHSGWQAGQPWGVEVRLPASFDPARADVDTQQSSVQWAAEGVLSADGAALPAFEHASVFLPAGARGPAFLVGPNFKVILRYNNSTSYALGVGLLAQRLDLGPGVLAAWPRDLKTLTRSQTRALQNALNQKGFDCGPADGLMGPATRSAVRRYQRSVDLPGDGFADLELLQRLQAQP